MTQILQLLVTIASTMQGSSALLAAKSWPQLLKAIPEHSLAIDVVKYTFLAAAHPSLDQSLYWDKLDGTLVTLVDSFKDTGDFTLFFECLNRILTASPPRVSKLLKNFIMSHWMTKSGKYTISGMAGPYRGTHSGGGPQSPSSEKQAGFDASDSNVVSPIPFTSPSTHLRRGWKTDIFLRI